MSAAATIDVLRSNLARGSELLGTLLWWSLADARVDRKTLEQLWASAALPPEYLPEVPTAEKSLKTAVRESAVGQDRLVRLGKEDEHELVFAILHESRDSEGNVTTQQEARVVLCLASITFPHQRQLDFPILVDRLGDIFEFLQRLFSLSEDRRLPKGAERVLPSASASGREGVVLRSAKREPVPTCDQREPRPRRTLRAGLRLSAPTAGSQRGLGACPQRGWAEPS